MIQRAISLNCAEKSRYHEENRDPYQCYGYAFARIYFVRAHSAQRQD